MAQSVGALRRFWATVYRLGGLRAFLNGFKPSPKRFYDEGSTPDFGAAKGGRNG